MKNNIKISIIIPVYNEERVVSKVIYDLKKFTDSLNNEFEIIAVNDGSTDSSGQELEKIHFIKQINHPYNKGYSASLKTGVKNSSHKWVLFFDCDGQHKSEYIKDLIKYSKDFDMIVGARSGYLGPAIRQPGKKILTLIANYLVDFKIPDLNSGFRLVKKTLFNKFLHLYPNKFSLTTTITLASIKEGFNIKFIPITINKRVGKSTVKPRHAIDTFVLINRIIILFSPMRIFFPLSLILGLLAIPFVVYDLMNQNISDISVITIITAIILYLFGNVLDQIAALRREMNNK